MDGRDLNARRGCKMCALKLKFIKAYNIEFHSPDSTKNGPRPNERLCLNESTKLQVCQYHSLEH